MHYSFMMCISMFLLFETVHGWYMYTLALCRVLGSLEHVEFIYLLNYNKVELIRFNSTESKFVGFTDYGVKWADDLNHKTEWLHQETVRDIAGCKSFGALYLPLLEKTVKPEVIIRSVRQASGKQPAMLICSAYDFYPKLIKMRWMRDGEVVTSDVSSIEDLSDGDWYYQIHSHLEYFPKPGEKIICVVEHASSNKPMIYHWDSSLCKFDENKIITGATGLVLGIIMTAGGFIYYKRKHTGFLRHSQPASCGTTNVMGVDDMVLD